MKNIFDLSDLSDLSNDIKKEIGKHNMRDDTIKLLSLFKIKDNLSLDEIIVGLFRKYKLCKKRAWISSTLYNLKSRDLIIKNDNLFSLARDSDPV